MMTTKPIFTATITGGLVVEYQKKNDGHVYWHVIGSTDWYDSTTGSLNAFNNDELTAIVQARNS